jgi:hypothetical protein
MKNYDLVRQQAWKRIEALRAQKQNIAPTKNTGAPAPSNSAEDLSKITWVGSREELMEHLLKAR